MKELSGFPYLEVEFDKQGKQVDKAQVDEAIREIGRLGVTDLIVWSHGWNNDMDEARDHYKRFAATMRAAADRHLADRTTAILGVLWPSKKFADSKLIPGGAAAGQDADEAALVGVSVFFQWFVSDPNGSWSGIGAWSDGLQAVIGR